jgi:hypothetical protein
VNNLFHFSTVFHRKQFPVPRGGTNPSLIVYNLALFSRKIKFFYTGIFRKMFHAMKAAHPQPHPGVLKIFFMVE